MPMLKLVAEMPDENGVTISELLLLDEKNLPTPLLLGLAGLELAFDAFIAGALARCILKRR